MSKTNNETASLHSGNKPKASEVRTLSLENDNDHVRQEAVEAQNTSLTSDGQKIRNVIPNTGKSVVANGSK